MLPVAGTAVPVGSCGPRLVRGQTHGQQHTACMEAVGRGKVCQSSAWDETTSPMSVPAPDCAGGPGPSPQHLGIVVAHEFYFPSILVTHRGLCCPPPHSSGPWKVGGWSPPRHPFTEDSARDLRGHTPWLPVGRTGHRGFRGQRRPWPSRGGRAPAPRSTGAGKLPRNPEVKQRRGARQSGASWEPPAAAAAREGAAASCKARLPFQPGPRKRPWRSQGPVRAVGASGGQCTQDTNLLPPAQPT